MIKLKKSNGNKTQNLKLWEKKNSKNSKYDKTQLVTKLKLWQNSTCDKGQIVTYSSCDKTQIVTKLKLWKKTKKKTQMWQNSDGDSSDSSDKKNFFHNKTFFSFYNFYYNKKFHK